MLLRLVVIEFWTCVRPDETLLLTSSSFFAPTTSKNPLWITSPVWLTSAKKSSKVNDDAAAGVAVVAGVSRATRQYASYNVISKKLIHLQKIFI